MNQLADSPNHAVPQTTVGELLKKIDVARERMSKKNDHRLLLLECKAAIINLAQRVPHEEVRTQAGIILP